MSARQAGVHHRWAVGLSERLGSLEASGSGEPQSGDTMRVVLVLMSGVVLAGALSGCASGTPAAGPTITVTATQTVTATPDAAETASSSPAVDPREGLFDTGYPKVVDTTEIPDYMQSSVDGDQVVQIAPGVWTEFIEGIDPVDLAVDGSPFGLCAATTKWERTLLNAGFNPGGSTCW